MLPHSFWSNRQLLMCSICPPWLPACSKEDLQAAGSMWSSWGWGEILTSLLLLFLDHHVLPMDNPLQLLSSSISSISRASSPVVLCLCIWEAWEIQTFEIWGFSEVGDLQLALPAAQQHRDLPSALSITSLTAHAVQHSSPQTHSNSRENSCWSQQEQGRATGLD